MGGKAGMKLIVIDDHILFREGLTKLIGRQPDMTVVGEGGTVRDAVELVRKYRPDLILMDFKLPDGTGVEAARAIIAEQPNARIVFLTSQEDDGSLFAVVRMGAKGLLNKN